MTTTNEDAGPGLTRAEFERACSLLPPDFAWGLPITPRLVLEIADALAPSKVQVEAVRATTDAARDVLAERQRQVSLEGWTPEHDDEHDSGEMASAAASYALHSSGWHMGKVRDVWPAPWSLFWLKPTTPRRDLVKAGALILAEIERIDRAAASGGEKEVES